MLTKNKKKMSAKIKKLFGYCYSYILLAKNKTKCQLKTQKKCHQKTKKKCQQESKTYYLVFEMFVLNI